MTPRRFLAWARRSSCTWRGTVIRAPRAVWPWRARTWRPCWPRPSRATRWRSWARADPSTALAFPVDQDGLLPTSRRLVGAMDAARPATRPLLALQQFLQGSLDAALAGCGLFGVINPANELVSPKRRQAGPQLKDPWIRPHRRPQIFSGLVDSPLGKGVHHEISLRRHGRLASFWLFGRGNP